MFKNGQKVRYKGYKQQVGMPIFTDTPSLGEIVTVYNSCPLLTQYIHKDLRQILPTEAFERVTTEDLDDNKSLWDKVAT